jgi:Pyrimidine dimer DNA glycosylase
VQTFLPYRYFAQSAASLDRQRLGKQRVETLQVIKTLVWGGGWANHPAVKMWRGHVSALLAYQQAVCGEWMQRGYRDTCLAKSFTIAMVDPSQDDLPSWLGDPAFHLSHQSNLIRKDPAYYRPLFPGVPDDLPYIWPVATS